ncbi:MAG TPA: phosphoglucosamine mutase [Mycobacteriales bacterium]|nr:phosphoglucosamine mutase [Mycobacteriales bacterium]
MGRLFGTDGVRGLANKDVTAELALSLSVAAAHIVAESDSGHRPLAVVGRDPRASGEFLEAAVVAGLASAGADVLRLGVLPTPGVAFLVKALGADLGVMLSASHNAMPDNGVKFFDSDGMKLADEVEDAIEARMNEPWTRPTGAAVGRVRDATDEVERYLVHLESVATTRLDGLRVVVDCANGAASYVAPEALRRAGADVIAVAAAPDGLNINDGVGSTHVESLAAAVLGRGADVGIAHDGDADRCLAVCRDGEVVDGDAILAICAVALQEKGRLAGDEVITTVMTNLGFKQAMAAQGISVVQTPVGDRYVLEAMRERGARLGGEQSGHVIFMDHASTGDGVVTALSLLSRMAETGRPLSDLAAVMQRLPQVLVNIRVEDKAKVDGSYEVASTVKAVEEELGDSGRVLVRPSGTEPLVRVMVEAATHDAARVAADRIADAVRRSVDA